MTAFIARSLIEKLVTLFFVTVVSFLIVHLAPGEPAQVDPLNPKFTPEMVERFRQAFHLDRPFRSSTPSSTATSSPAGASPGRTIGRCWRRSPSAF